MTVISKIASTETLQYLLVKMDKVLDNNEKIFLDLEKLDSLFPFQPLLKFSFLNSRLLSKGDEFLSLKAGKIMTALICHSPLPSYEILNVMCGWVSKLLTQTDKDKLELATNSLSFLLRNNLFRKLFVESSSGIKDMCALLKDGPSISQLQYQLLFDIWLITFDSNSAYKMQEQYQILTPIIEIAKNSSKEKIIRVCMAICRNMYEKAKEVSVPIMIGGKLLNFLTTLQARNFSDEEIIGDISFLQEELSKVLQNLSSFDEYHSEIVSGKLEWSPSHQSELFWKQNCHRFAEKDNEILKSLTRILCTSTSNQVLSIACHDVGQYIKFCPSARDVLQSLGTKQQIMQLMNHPDSDVRYNAIMAVQKYMANIWSN